MIPFHHQIVGAQFLAKRQAALLADEPRVGKTGAAIMAADMVGAIKILIVTTASGRAVWRRALADWSVFRRTINIVESGPKEHYDVTVFSWAGVSKASNRAWCMAKKFDLAILDEGHMAKNFEAARTRAVYGEIRDGGAFYTSSSAATRGASRVWVLTGTPIPNGNNDLFPVLRALKPQALEATANAPSVTRYEDFLHRFCKVGYKKISNFHKIPVVLGGKNEEELKARIGDFMLLRTQQDVGIHPPIYETMPLMVSSAVRAKADALVDTKVVLEAAEAGREMEMHISPLRRFTGSIKADALIEALKEEFDCGLDKVVIMAWHTGTINKLAYGLEKYGVVTLDGSTPMIEREFKQDAFTRDRQCRVFIGQVLAAGEAIDLSAAAELIFCETSTVPSHMKQASLRITNHTQKRQARVRVAVLEGSIDEKIETILLNKWASIKQVLST